MQPFSSNFQRYSLEIYPNIQRISKDILLLSTLQWPQSTQNLALSSWQRYKSPLANVGSKPHFRSSLPAQDLLKVTRIKSLSHLLKRAVPFWRWICIIVHADTTKVALNFCVVEPTNVCQQALPTQAPPSVFLGHWILCFAPLLLSKHHFDASLDANRSRMESSFLKCIYLVW